jgi:RHS repeat-associated protein
MQWVWSTSYSNTGQLNGFQTFFGAYSAYYGYSYNTLRQLSGVAYGTNIANTNVNLTYTYPTGSNNGRIAQFSDSSTGEVVNYTYDALNRLIAATTSNSTGPVWGESYTYDGFGNLLSKTATQGSAPQASLVVNSATNQLGNAGSVDANGNALWGTGTDVTQFAWDGENRLVAPAAQDSSGNWVTYSYDPWGKRVLQYASAGSASTVSTCVLFFYGANGKRLGTYNCGYNNGQFTISTANINVYFGKKLIATGSEMSQNAVITDRLGSVRGQNFSASIAYFPYGEERTSTPNGTEKFGTYFRDGYGQDYADQRYYTSNYGRFWSPDPGGIAAANPRNPGSWNRYGYAKGDLANYYDPAGTDDINAGCAAFDDAFCDGSALESNDPMNTGVMAPPGLVNVQCSAMYGLGWEFGGGVAVAACTISPEQYDDLVDGPPAPTCTQVLTSDITSYLATYDGGASPLNTTANIQALVTDGMQYDVDPRFIVALAVAETQAGTNMNWGPYNAWNIRARWPGYTGAGKKPPYTSWSQSIQAINDLISGSAYFGAGLTTTSAIYALYQGPGGETGLANLNTALGQMQGTQNALTDPCNPKNLRSPNQ